MELKKAIYNLLDGVTDEGSLMYFYALLRQATSSVTTEEVLEEVFTLVCESNQLRDAFCLEAS